MSIDLLSDFGGDLVAENYDSSLSSFGGLPTSFGTIGTPIHQRVMDVTHAFMIQICILVSDVPIVQFVY